MVFLWLVSSEAKFLMVELLQPTCSVLGILEWDTGEVIFTDVRKKEQPHLGQLLPPTPHPRAQGDREQNPQCTRHLTWEAYSPDKEQEVVLLLCFVFS